MIRSALTTLVLLLTSITTAIPAPAATLIVSNRGEGTVSFIDTDTNAVIQQLNVELGAHEFAVSPDGTRAVGSCYGSGPGHKTPDQRLFVLDIPERKLLKTIDLGDNPRPNDIRFLDDHTQIVVTSEVKQRLLTVNIESGEIVKVTPFNQKAGHMLALAPDGKTAYVSCVFPGCVAVVDMTGEADTQFITTAPGAEGVDLSPDGKRLWVGNNRSESISIIDTATREVISTIDTDGFPFRIRFTPDGAKVVISHPGASEVRIYAADTTELLHKVKLVGKTPSCLAVAPDGAHAYVVCGSSGTVTAITLETGETAAVIETGRIPDAIGISPLSPKKIESTPATTPATPPDH
jgi:YVTN family beta-propeller protein